MSIYYGIRTAKNYLMISAGAVLGLDMVRHAIEGNYLAAVAEGLATAYLGTEAYFDQRKVKRMQDMTLFLEDAKAVMKRSDEAFHRLSKNMERISADLEGRTQS